MKWLLQALRLSRMGVLGINRRNADCILQRNPRSRFPVVDDKPMMAELCRRVGVPTPAILHVVNSHGELRDFVDRICQRDEFVIKPARGAGGRGILVIVDREGDDFRKSNGRVVSIDGLVSHASDILSGLFSLGGHVDRVVIQQRVRPHPYFLKVAPRGIADIRIVLYRFEPVMAMLRLPTLVSNGRANLHQGGIGVGLDLESGTTFRAIQQGRTIARHPDTGVPLFGLTVPDWPTILEMSRRVARAVGLGYVGVDVVIDETDGPFLLEANARPGLAIQLANGAGLRLRMEEIDRQLA